MTINRPYKENDLTQEERRIIGECLHALSSGKFIEDWEFQTVCGVERAQMARVALEWPYVDDKDSIVDSSIRSSMGNLLGYPHGREVELSERVSASQQEIRSILQKWLQLSARS